jgi:ketosteroid isomerase-like protein
MKSVLIVSALALCNTLAFAQEHDEKTVTEEKAILAAEREFIDANKKGDATTLQRLLREDYINIDVNGGIQSKVELLKVMDASAASPTKALTGFSSMNAIRIRPYGDVAVLTAGANLGGPKGYAVRYTHIWVKTKDQWLLSNSQVTRMTATKP